MTYPIRLIAVIIMLAVSIVAYVVIPHGSAYPMTGSTITTDATPVLFAPNTNKEK